MDLSIIIVNWNTRDLLAQCLEAVAQNIETLDGKTVETFVVDNASADDSVAMLREYFPWVLLIENESNQGFAKANNQAILQACGDYLLLLNSDAVLLPASVHGLLNCINEVSHVGAIGPTLLNANHTFQASSGRFPTVISCFVQLLGLARRVYGPDFPSASPQDLAGLQPADWVGGACFMIRRSAMEDVGLLDEDMFMYAEEMDWCYRLWRAGWQVAHCPDVAVIHLGGASSGVVRPWVLARQWKSQLRFIQKHHGLAEALLVRAGVGVLGVMRTLFFAALAVLSPDQRDRLLTTSRANLNMALLRTNA